MSKEKKGHEREAHGYKLTTSLEANGWAVQIVPKPRSRGAGKGEIRPVLGVDKDGFAFEGEALDWAEDWATTNRVYSVEVNSKDHGVAAEVMDDSGVTLWTSAVCAEASEARNRADTFIRARRAHDQEVLKARQANRANYRLLLDDERAKEEKQQALHRRSLRNDVILWARALAWKGKKRANPPPEPEEPSEGLIRIAWVTSVVFGGNHHVDTPTRMFGGPGRAFAAFRLHGTIASWDFNEMTRLTIAAHEAAVRVEVAVGGFRQLEIILHARERQGGMASRHPTMEEAIGLVKSWRWSDCPVPVPAGDDPGSNMDRAPVEA